MVIHRHPRHPEKTIVFAGRETGIVFLRGDKSAEASLNGGRLQIRRCRKKLEIVVVIRIKLEVIGQQVVSVG